MYCPRCGREMQPDGITLKCVAGDMPLSIIVHRRLIERFPDILPRAATVPREAAVGRFYCPGCGDILTDAHICPRCGKSIGDLMFHLIELHPHRRG